MTQTPILQNQQQFIANATDFFHIIFNPILNSGLGDIEIRTFPKNQSPQQFFWQSESAAAQISCDLCNNGIDVYFGVNPRTGQAGKKENIHYVAAFHAEVDYGTDGHKKKPIHANYDEALSAIETYKMKPTILNHSGGGFHCYWVLSNPVRVLDMGIEYLEGFNKALNKYLGGDGGTHNLDRVLRVPGTFNFKLANNPREVVNFWMDGPSYSLEDFKWILREQQIQKDKTPVNAQNETQPQVLTRVGYIQDIDQLPVSDKIKSLILNGSDGTYPSRSEADMAVILALVNKGISESVIHSIFENHAIGEKYREHSSPDVYLKHNIEKAKEFDNLTEEERQDPLFISGALHKNDSGKYRIRIVSFQEYMNKKHKLKYLEMERTHFRYNGKCYEPCRDERLNFLCQKELGGHRELFTKAELSNFIHYSIADDLVNAQKVYDDQARYLTVQNGIYDLIEHKIIDHTPDIFTTNLLPYDYDPEAFCPRWLQYLDEVFLSDSDSITFVQEAIGYSFYKKIPTPALFFLVGSGSNGKSVFINTLSSLCGDENVSNISLNLLTNEIYILDLFGKMINVSSETPNKKFVNTDLVKAVVAGDYVTGRELYKKPFKFKSFAKHFLAMNKLPNIDDNTHGMWRRIYVINFPRKFEESEMDRELTEKLKLELSGLFNWALEGYERLKTRDFSFNESESMINLTL